MQESREAARERDTATSAAAERLPTCLTDSAAPPTLDRVRAAAVDETRLRGVPVMYVRLDPGAEWLADVRLRQPLGMWELQLEKVGGSCCSSAQGPLTRP